MQKFRTMMIAALMMTASGAALAADEAAAPKQQSGTFSGTLEMVSDYVYRGVTQTDDHPAIQGSFDYEHSSGLYAGVWGSNVDFNDGGVTSLEADIYGGYKFESDSIKWDMGLTGYVYPGSNQGTNHYNYMEGKLAASKTFGIVEATATANYSPNYFGDSGKATYLSLDASAPVMDTGLTFTASGGHQWISDNANFGLPDYSDWSAGLGYSWQGFDFAVKYTDTNVSKSDCSSDCDARAVFSVSRSFD